MSNRATGKFELKWDEKPAYDDAEGAALARVTITKKFEGDLVGSSVTEMIKAMTDVPDSAAYVAIERVIGSLHGRSGTFVLQHAATMGRGQRSLSVTVVPDSGTGELKGIEGKMDVHPEAGHTFEFDYTLGDDD